MSVEPLLLLSGASALALAPRLSASGYATVDWPNADGTDPMVAVLEDSTDNPLGCHLHIR